MEVRAWAIKTGTGKLMPWAWKTKREAEEFYNTCSSIGWAEASKAGMKVVRVRIVEEKQ